VQIDKEDEELVKEMEEALICEDEDEKAFD